MGLRVLGPFLKTCNYSSRTRASHYEAKREGEPENVRGRKVSQDTQNRILPISYTSTSQKDGLMEKPGAENATALKRGESQRAVNSIKTQEGVS